jgi:mono/diheme cytochrome c family protein
VVGKLDWPGKPAPAVEVAALTPAEQKRYDAGAELYKGVCVGCHQPDGRGKEKLAPSLVDSAYVKGPDPSTSIRILLSGKEGAIGLMPPLGGALSDEQVASVLTYIRREWGHAAAPVTPEDVVEVRGLTRTRARPWTDAELQQERGGRGAAAGRGGQP